MLPGLGRLDENNRLPLSSKLGTLAITVFSCKVDILPPP
jgi:hypothetical protein